MPAGASVAYSALGASDVNGIGSSNPCLVPFGDCPNSTGYVFVAAQSLRTQGYTVTVSNLGLPGAVISSHFQTLGQQHGRDIVGNLIDNLLPFVPRDATLVTILTGPNDVNVVSSALGAGAGGADPGGYVDQQVQVFGTDYDRLVRGVRDRAPSARIVVFNLPNLAGLPFLAGAATPVRQAAQRASVRMTTTVINPRAGSNLRVIDLMCDPRFYQRTSYSPDGYHPGDEGYAAMASEVVRAATSATFPAPQASCSQMTLVP
jgi:lysophospholipase L1-like esterase